MLRMIGIDSYTYKYTQVSTDECVLVCVKAESSDVDKRAKNKDSKHPNTHLHQVDLLAES